MDNRNTLALDLAAIEECIRIAGNYRGNSDEVIRMGWDGFKRLHAQCIGRPAPEASPPALEPDPILWEMADATFQVLQYYDEHKLEARTPGAQMRMEDLREAYYRARPPGLPPAPAPAPGREEPKPNLGSEGTGPEAPERAREKTARLILWILQDQRVFPAGSWEEYDDETRAQMLQYADRFREAAPASVRPSEAEPLPNLTPKKETP